MLIVKFLIVDDNREFRTLIKEIIAKEGDKCFELDDGLDVNLYYRKYKPDWVLLDIVMKKVNGIKAAEKLLEEFPEARFVFVSGYTEEKYRKKANELGAVGFVSKENLSEIKKILNKDEFPTTQKQ
jgi:DNA-binding NarL/FixJ family response regulator